MIDRIGLGMRIRKARKARGLTQGELGGRIGKSQSFVGQMERGQKQASAETLARLCRTLEVQADALLFGQDSEG